MRAATEGSLPLVMPRGNLVEVLGREVRQGSPGELMVESSPSRQMRHHVKQTRRCQMRLWTRPPLLTYLLRSFGPTSAKLVDPGATPGREVRHTETYVAHLGVRFSP